MNEEIYQKFISDISRALQNLANQIEPLGFANGIYNDNFVIEIAIKNKPVRLSLKFRKNQLKCCINLRPYSDKIGSENYENTQKFIAWIEKTYQDSPRNTNQPYFKPFGKEDKKIKKTKDTFFCVEDFTKKQKLESCPEFPNSKEKVELNLLEAIQIIIEKT